MQPPASLRNRSFYAKFYSRNPTEIEIIDSKPSSCILRTLSASPATITPLSDAATSPTTSGFFSSPDCSSSESTSSYTKRRRTTAPTIQERLNTYESACHRPSLPLPTPVPSKPKPSSMPCRSSSLLVNQIVPQQTPVEQTKPKFIKKSHLVANDLPKAVATIHDDPSSSLSSTSRINAKSISLDSSKRYLSKSASQLCDQSSLDRQVEPVSSSRNVLDIIQEELSEIRRTDHDLKTMFLSIYGKIQNIQQLKSTTLQQHKGQRYAHHHNERPSRSLAHSCYSSNSDIRRSSCTRHPTRKYALHTVAALRHRMNHVNASSTADNDSYVDTDSSSSSSSSSSDSGTCSSPVDNEPCADD